MNEQNTNKEIIDLDYAAEDQYLEDEDFDEVQEIVEQEENPYENRKPGTFYPGDPRINRHGRPIVPKSRRKTSREKKLDDLNNLLRRVKPQAADAFRQMSALMMGKNGTPHAQQLAAAKFMLEFQRQLLEDIHKEHEAEKREQEEKRKAKQLEKQKTLELDNPNNKDE